MSDFILSLNIDESKKTNHIIFETYEGFIPKLKSRKYSGQLLPVNVNTEKSYDNVDYHCLKNIRAFLNATGNTQINKYRFCVCADALKGFEQLLNTKCCFYQHKKTGMYSVDSVRFERISSCKDALFDIDGVQCFTNKTTLYFFVNLSKQPPKNLFVQAKAYVDISTKKYVLDLLFEYDDFLIRYPEKNNRQNTLTDYAYESQVVKVISEAGWYYSKRDGFVYEGKQVLKSLDALSNEGIEVYTNSKKRIVSADFSDVSVSYDIDWFDIQGGAKVAKDEVDIATLLSLRKNREEWVEYDGKIVFLPQSLLNPEISVHRDTNVVTLNKKQVIVAMSLAEDLNHSVVRNLEELIAYSNVLLEIEPSMEQTLRPYQRVGVQWLLSLHSNGFGACLADDMGLGKTIQVIAFLSDNRLKNGCNLVIAPKTLLLNWQREIEKFSPNTTVCIYHGQDRDIFRAKENHILITTYQTAVNDVSLLREVGFECVIVDEAQNIKNVASKSYRAIKSIPAAMKIILTGTPLENNAKEFLGLMKLINPDVAFERRLNVSDEQVFLSNLRAMCSPFLLRRMKKDVLTDLPQKCEQTLIVDMDKAQRELYDKLLSNLRYEIEREPDRFEIKSFDLVLKGLLYLQEVCCHPQLLEKELNEGCKQSVKLEVLAELIENLYGNQHKVVIFSRFTRMLKIIKNKVSKMNLNIYYLDGNTMDRIAVVDAFEHDENGIFLISLKAGGTGLNLVSADTAILFDPWWNPAVEQQAADRIYRIGQQKSVMIYKLICANTIEEKIQLLQQKKHELAMRVLEGREVPATLSADMIKRLIVGD